MELKDYIEFANKNPACYVATNDGDQPRVRGFLLWFADESGFCFHTGTPKNVCKQLKKNPKIEVCFIAPSQDPSKMKMFIDDLTLKARLLEERPFLKAIGTGKPDDPLLSVFKIYTGEAHFWTMENDMREGQIEKVTF
jgi:uncharacterized pyridoxamine 5'-phosphate oxidase family protein